MLADGTDLARDGAAAAADHAKRVAHDAKSTLPAVMRSVAQHAGDAVQCAQETAENSAQAFTGSVQQGV